jgi:hypothetical protein
MTGVRRKVVSNVPEQMSKYLACHGEICVFLQWRAPSNRSRAQISRGSFDAKFHAASSNIDAVLQIRKRGLVQTSPSYVLCMIRDAAREQAARSER